MYIIYIKHLNEWYSMRALYWVLACHISIGWIYDPSQSRTVKNTAKPTSMLMLFCSQEYRATKNKCSLYLVVYCTTTTIEKGIHYLQNFINISQISSMRLLVKKQWCVISTLYIFPQFSMDLLSKQMNHKLHHNCITIAYVKNESKASFDMHASYEEVAQSKL